MFYGKIDMPPATVRVATLPCVIETHSIVTVTAGVDKLVLVREKLDEGDKRCNPL